MASFRRQMWISSNVAFLAVIGGLLVISCTAQEFCPKDCDTLVYPYWSLCTNPAVYQDPYYLVSANRDEGGLIAEWDQSNLTYYVRLTGSSNDLGDVITLLTVDGKKKDTCIHHGDTVLVATSKSKPYENFWGWKKEGETEWFLEDQHRPLGSNPVRFNIVEAPNVLLPCPFIEGARCKAYYLTSTPGDYSSGLAMYIEDGVTYIKLGDKGSNGDMPLLLIRHNSAQGHIVS